MEKIKLRKNTLIQKCGSGSMVTITLTGGWGTNSEFIFNTKTGDVMCWDLIYFDSGDYALDPCVLGFNTASLTWSMGMGFSISAADNVVTITAGGDARAQFTTDIGTGITFPEEQWLKLAFKRNEYSGRSRIQLCLDLR